MGNTQAPIRRRAEPAATALLTSQQTADYLGVSDSTLRKWRMAAEGPPWHHLAAKAVRYRRSDVDAWLLETRVDPGAAVTA